MISQTFYKSHFYKSFIMARCKFRSVFVAIRLYFEVECNIQPVLLSILYILTQTKRLPGSVQNCLFSTVIFGMTSLADEFVILGTDDVRRWSVVVQKMVVGDSLEGDVTMVGGRTVVWLVLLAIFYNRWPVLCWNNDNIISLSDILIEWKSNWKWESPML